MTSAPAGTVHAEITSFTAADGQNLALYDWHWPRHPRAVALLVHGLGEHMGRYESVARRLTDWGLAVRGYDQYGHGASSGPRGGLSSDTRLLDDLADIVDATRAHMARRHLQQRPLVLLGHSLGGLVAARFVALALRPVDALVLSSPALDAGLNSIQKLLVATLPRLAPNLRVGNGLRLAYLSHDPAVIAAYRTDPLVHDQIAARLARFIATAGPATVRAAPDWRVPTLLMWAGQDRLVNPSGSAAFAQAAPSNLVTARCFDAAYHELFNEPDSGPVFTLLQSWLGLQLRQAEPPDIAA
ncbi:MAG: alpha/beta hydrolase [Burkholderiaceae bacterium]|jgi:alpha-beta hydrolase superfamily lysophospholipase|nr:MAG: alpha/beta hydrolase [Burkholderiaceae bacterium]